jgi:hypothetical protein
MIIIVDGVSWWTAWICISAGVGFGWNWVDGSDSVSMTNTLTSRRRSKREWKIEWGVK